MYKLLFFLIPLLGLQQEKDHRKVYTKEYFENWYQNSNLTILENDTLREIQKILDQTYQAPDHRSYQDQEHRIIELDSNSNEINREQVERLLNKRYGKRDCINKISESEKYVFYNSYLKFLVVDSLDWKWDRNKIKTIHFNPILAKIEGKLIYIDSTNINQYHDLYNALNMENDNAIGYSYDSKMYPMDMKIWSSYYLENAPFNRHIQNIISADCLNYNPSVYMQLISINRVKTIILTRNFKEALITVNPCGSRYFYIKKEGKWIINKKRPPLVEYIL